MMRKSFASGAGVVLDRCRAHGVWLDRGELEKTLAFVRSGGLLAARRREVERLGQEERQARERIDAQGRPSMSGSVESHNSDLVRILTWLGQVIPHP